jgi:hypothetical protein
MPQAQNTHYDFNTSREQEKDESGLMHQAADQARQLGNQAGEMATRGYETAKEYPYATIAIAAGLAFAVGALWKGARSYRRQSQLEAMMARLQDLNRDNIWSRLWR